MCVHIRTCVYVSLCIQSMYVSLPDKPESCQLRLALHLGRPPGRFTESIFHSGGRRPPTRRCRPGARVGQHAQIWARCYILGCVYCTTIREIKKHTTLAETGGGVACHFRPPQNPARVGDRPGISREDTSLKAVLPEEKLTSRLKPPPGSLQSPRGCSDPRDLRPGSPRFSAEQRKSTRMRLRRTECRPALPTTGTFLQRKIFKVWSSKS